jgi:hypothetical protein
MQRFHLKLLLLGFVFLGGCYPSEKPDDKIQSIKISPSVLDFGCVRTIDNPVQVSFTIENLQDKSLEILEIISGCGCTVWSMFQLNHFFRIKK